MKNATATLVLVIGLLVTAGYVTMAAEIVTTRIDVECPGGGPSFVLWIEGDDGTCKETSPGAYACFEPGDDFASATCATTCVTTTIENLAGCFDKSRGPLGSIATPYFSVTCGEDGNHRLMDLEGVEGDNCTREVNESGEVIGGQCSQMNNGVEEISAKGDCDTGCVSSQPPGDCTDYPNG